MRLLAAGFVAASVAAVVVLPTPNAAARPPTCSRARGTIVAVDFGHWGGPVVAGCGVAAGSGYQLLHDGGFSTAGTVHDGPGFVCRLGNEKFRNGTQFPTAHEDPCVVTPPESAYWSYWTAGRHSNAWSYDGLGAMSDVPVSGGVELWQFGGKGAQPSVTPDQLRARATQTTTQSAPAAPAAEGTSASPAPAIAAGAIVVVLGGGAGFTVWRRRRARP
jgi:hypothetical protein